MKKITLILCCYLLMINVWAKEKTPKRIHFYTDLSVALAEAKESRKLVFVDCYADWVLACRSMDSLVLTDPLLVDFIHKNFIPLWVDMASTKEGKQLARQYGVKTFAHYLVLDADGQVVHRIVGGARAEPFQQSLKAALSPKTSLTGMTKRYEAGERSPKFLYTYAEVLKKADMGDQYKEVQEYYLQHVNERQLLKAESWPILRRAGMVYDSEWYNFIYNHREELVKENGKEVLDLLLAGAIRSTLDFVSRAKAFDEVFVTRLEDRVNTLVTDSPVKKQTLDIYRMLRLRGQKQYGEMLEVWQQVIPSLNNEIVERSFDMTLGQLFDLEPRVKEDIVVYLEKQMVGVSRKTLEMYQETIQLLKAEGGIRFVNVSLQEALEQARTEKKLVFVDCYTSWCAPCKMMATKVFPTKEAGDFFNPAFVSIKIDMEKGEGRQLAKQWKVQAFPTYVILNTEGEVLYSTMGYIPAGELIRRVQEGLQQYKNSNN